VDWHHGRITTLPIDANIIIRNEAQSLLIVSSCSPIYINDFPIQQHILSNANQAGLHPHSMIVLSTHSKHSSILPHLNFLILLNQSLPSDNPTMNHTQQSQHQCERKSVHSFPSISYLARTSPRCIQPKIHCHPGQSIATAAYPQQAPVQ
jgi:hypothetical protein